MRVERIRVDNYVCVYVNGVLTNKYSVIGRN
jgi:hypothetical protein